MTDKLQIPDGDHVLTDGKAWLTVGPYAVRINKTDEGLSVDIYEDGNEMGELLGATWVLDNDLEIENVQTNQEPEGTVPNKKPTSGFCPEL